MITAILHHKIRLHARIHIYRLVPPSSIAAGRSWNTYRTARTRHHSSPSRGDGPGYKCECGGRPREEAACAGATDGAAR